MRGLLNFFGVQNPLQLKETIQFKEAVKKVSGVKGDNYTNYFVSGDKIVLQGNSSIVELTLKDGDLGIQSREVIKM